MQPIAHTASRIVESEVSKPGCCSCKMVIMITGVAIAAIGLLVAAFAHILYLAAAFTILEISLIVGTVTVRAHQKMKSLPEISSDLRTTNNHLHGNVLSLEAQVDELKEQNAELKETLDKVKMLPFIVTRSEEATTRLERLLAEEEESKIRLQVTADQLDRLEARLDYQVTRVTQQADRLTGVELNRRREHNTGHGTDKHERIQTRRKGRNRQPALQHYRSGVRKARQRAGLHPNQAETPNDGSSDRTDI